MKSSRIALLLDYLNPRRRLRFTREGWVITFLALALGLISVNTGHNLFYLFLGLLLSAVTVSGVISERMLRGIEVSRRLPPEITARVPFAVVLEVRNRHAKRFRYSLKVTDEGDFFPRRVIGYAPSLASGESRSFHYLLCVEKRGFHRFGRVHLSTTFPFGLFEKVRLVELATSFIAHPGLRETSELRKLAWGRDRAGRRKWRWGEEILGLRAALPWDDHRFIHWRTSARLGQLMVKEFAEEIEQPRLIFFDHRGEQDEKFEEAVEIAANLARLLNRDGVPFVFATWDRYFHGGELRPLLDHLALISPVRVAAGPGFEKWRLEASREGGGIFLSASGTPPQGLPPCELVRVA